MTKAILVIDMPDCCRECPLCGEDRQTYRDYCRITADYIWTLDKPEWCPLKTMPQEQIEGGTWTADGYIEDGFPIGWNACIDEILGG